MQAQLTQEVKRADSLSTELERQQDDSSRGPKSTTKSHRGTGDLLAGRTTGQGGVDPLIPASRPTAGSELELLRRKLKVCCIVSLNGSVGELHSRIEMHASAIWRS